MWSRSAGSSCVFGVGAAGDLAAKRTGPARSRRERRRRADARLRLILVRDGAALAGHRGGPVGEVGRNVGMTEGLNGAKLALQVLKSFFAKVDTSLGTSGDASSGIIGMLEVIESELTKGISKKVATDVLSDATSINECKDTPIEKTTKCNDSDFKANNAVVVDLEQLDKAVDATKRSSVLVSGVPAEMPEFDLLELGSQVGKAEWAEVDKCGNGSIGFASADEAISAGATASKFDQYMQLVAELFREKEKYLASLESCIEKTVVAVPMADVVDRIEMRDLDIDVAVEFLRSQIFRNKF